MNNHFDDTQKEKILDEFIQNFKSFISKIDPKLAGFLIGSITPKIYELLSDEQKRRWKEIFPIHHGEAGVVLTTASIIGRLVLELFPASSKKVEIAKKIFETLIGVGGGLIIDDIADFNKWFKKEVG
ncbi:MAG: hypothetical protein ACTSYB_17400 [Candidatus Helarchaeota archaeon]